MHKSPTIELAKQLITKPSVTPEDAGCQDILIAELKKLEFDIELLPFENVKNFWAKRGTEQPLFIFAGHTDVVPPGLLTAWTSPPFQPEIRNGYLYGRGAADMKSSLAAMVIATKNFIQQFPDHKGSIAFLITSDEEGLAVNGTHKVVEHLTAKGEKLNWCLVGEASSSQHLGDTIKIGRRGSLNGHLIIQGKQGHIAYPQLANNPIHKALASLQEFCDFTWDESNKYFPATSFQISNIHAGAGAENVIPQQLEVKFNFRYSPSNSAENLQKQVLNILNQYNLDYNVSWSHSGLPFITEQGELLIAAQQAILELTGITAELSTSGGTSDGRFIAPTGCQVIELGPCNASIHQIDEHICISDLAMLSKIYQRILELLLQQ